MTAGITNTFFGTVCEVHPEQKGLRYKSSQLCPLCSKAASREQYVRERKTGIMRGQYEFEPQAHKLNKLWPATTEHRRRDRYAHYY